MVKNKKQNKQAREKKYLSVRKLLVTEERDLLVQRVKLNKRLSEIRSELASWDTYLINEL